MSFNVRFIACCTHIYVGVLDYPGVVNNRCAKNRASQIRTDSIVIWLVRCSAIQQLWYILWDLWLFSLIHWIYVIYGIKIPQAHPSLILSNQLKFELAYLLHPPSSFSFYMYALSPFSENWLHSASEPFPNVSSSAIIGSFFVWHNREKWLAYSPAALINAMFSVYARRN